MPRMNDAPPSSLMDSTMSPKVKTTEGEGIRHVLWLKALWGVEEHAEAS